MQYPVIEAQSALVVSESEAKYGAGKSRWQQYLDLLAARKIPEKARHYYCRHVEALLAETGRTPVRQLTREGVESFFRRRAERDELADWQLRQCVDAIRLLLVDLAQAPVGGEIDWGFWRDGQRRLEADHATVARETSVAHSARRVAERFGAKGNDSLMQALITEIRVRHYSIRTEQAYSQWVARFLAFCQTHGNSHPTAEQVPKYLEYLAVERNVAASTQS